MRNSNIFNVKNFLMSFIIVIFTIIGFYACNDIDVSISFRYIFIVFSILLFISLNTEQAFIVTRHENKHFFCSIIVTIVWYTYLSLIFYKFILKP